jgi:hypothetical protein
VPHILANTTNDTTTSALITTAVFTGYKRESDGATVLLIAQHANDKRLELEEAYSDLYSGRFEPDTMCYLHEYVFDVPAKKLLSHDRKALSSDARPFELPAIGKLSRQ